MGDALALRRTAHLQRPVGNAQPARRVLQVSVLIAYCNPDGGVGGGLTDFFEANSQRHGSTNRKLEGAVAPLLGAELHRGSLSLWNIPQCDRPWPHVAITHA